MDEWDKIDQEFAGEGWRPTGKTEAPASWDSVDALFKKQTSAPAKPRAPIEPPRVNPDQFKGSTLQVGPLDTKIPLPASVAMGLAQIGSGIMDPVLGYKQIFGNATRADADEKKKLDDPLNRGFAGTLNNIVGKALPFTAVPFGVLNYARGAGPILEGALTGASQGALDPVGTGESRARNMAVGAAAGAAAPTAMAVVRGTNRPADAQVERLIQSADREGIPLGLADTTQNKLVRAFKSIADDMPGTAGGNAAQREAQQEAFNRAMGSRWGSPVAKHTPSEVTAARQRMGQEFQDIWSNNNLPYNADLFQRLRAAEARTQFLPENEARRMQNYIQDLENRVQADAKGNLFISGEAAHNFQSMLGAKAPKDGALRNEMGDLRRDILDVFNQSVAGTPYADRLQRVQQQYRAFKTVEPLIRKAEAGMSGRVEGDIPASLVPGAVMKGYPTGNVTDTPFGDLPQIGGRFLADRTERTGGSNRALIQNAGVASLLSAPAWLGAPALTAAGAGAFYGANRAVTSPAIRRLIQDPVVTRAMLANPNTADATRTALQSMVRRSPAPAALAGMGALTSTGGARADGRGSSLDDLEE